MNWSFDTSDKPMKLVVTGEAEYWLPTLAQIVGPRWLLARKATSDSDLLEAIRTGAVDAAVLDDQTADDDLDLLMQLRMIRRIAPDFPVVIVTRHTDRQYLESALRLAVFSVVVKPLEFEDLLRQIHSIMSRLAKMLEHRNNNSIN